MPSWRILGFVGGLLGLLGGFSAGAAEPGLSPVDASTLTAAGKITLVDVRTPAEWRESGVPPGAKRLDYRNRSGDAAFVEQIAAMVGGNRAAPLAIICRSGNRSAQVQTLLIQNGFSHVLNVSEGMWGGAAGPGWLRRGLPVEPCPTC